MIVIRDKEGNVINIGPWDFQTQEYEDDSGVIREIINNPLPEGAIESEEDVVTGWDGGLYVEGDPRAIKS